MEIKPLIEVVKVSKCFYRKNTCFKAVQTLSMQIFSSETVGLVGESGSGKSTLAKMLLMLEPPSEGEIFFNGKNLSTLARQERQEIRQQIQIVFQNPYAALNPCMTLEQILNEPLDIHKLYMKSKRSKRIADLLYMVGLDKSQLNKYPHQFSGGQLQRICIARALAVEPRFLVCDEPLSALDVSIQAQIINLLKNCQKELGLTMLFISHDLAAVDLLADRTLVMYQGQIVEEGPTSQVFNLPKHPYTQQLLHAHKVIGLESVSSNGPKN